MMLSAFSMSCVYFFDAEHVGAGFSGRTNIVYCAVYFLAGGLIYRYRERLERYAEKYRVALALLLAASIGAYLAIGASVITMLPMFSLMVICSLSEKRRVLHNPVTHFIAGISMEIYLCHMVIYRVLERTHLLYVMKGTVTAYLTAVLLVLTGSIVFALCTKKMLERAATYGKAWLGKSKGG